MSAGYMRRCAGKTRHDTREQAAGEKASLVARKGVPADRMSVYQCDQCLGWHVGGAGNAFHTRLKPRGRRGRKRANRSKRGRT